ncbi:MAG: hypothetical protein BGO78_13420 [Chloroflexi bacterium 44-23]|nr:MAG: hypothetical protein BGO78_13420 [Chloroflexi bacterium 44-23]
MPTIAIITDSDASIPLDLAALMNIVQVPITIHFGDESYTSNLDIDDEKLFKLIDQKNKLPTTAAPPPSAFFVAFQNALSEGAQTIICITVSSKISATFSAAETAREMLPDSDITVIDSENLCMGQGFIVLEAAKKAAAGANKDEVLRTISSLSKRIHVFAALPTLKYLAMSGRVGKIAAGMADVFNVKPILTAQNGKLDLLEKVRTQKKAEKRLVELIDERLLGKSIDKLAMIHVNNLQGAQKLLDLLQEKITCNEEIIFANFGPGLSVHAGSGVIGFVAVERENGLK